MRVLIISYFFPPYNTIGAVRVGKIAKYLRKQGYDVRVVTAADQPLQPTLHMEVPEQHVIATRWLNVNRPIERLLGGREQVAAKGYVTQAGGSRLGRFLKKMGRVYKCLLHYPDAQIGWYPHAVRAADRVIREWQPDLIFASGAPFTSLVVAARLAQKHRLPWVAELRDLWTDNANYAYPRWRRWLERRLERRVLSSAGGLVTVSEPLAELLRGKYQLPTTVVKNGFDPDDYPIVPPKPLYPDKLDIVYTGMVYEGKQDPQPLFTALKGLGSRADSVRVTFYGRYLDSVRQLARQNGVEHLIEVCDPVPYQEVLQIQSRADLLLLLLWTDTSEKGVYTGKLFEYIGARRPVLAVGPSANVASDLIEQRGAGVVVSDPPQIAAQLEEWLWLKRVTGRLPAVETEAAAGLSREDGARELAHFFANVLRGRRERG